MRDALVDLFPLGLGTSRLCSLNGGLSVGRAVALVQEAFRAGVRFVDTAPSYGQGQVEEAIGRLPASMRAELTVCTKVGYSYGLKGRAINLAKPIVRPILKRVEGARRFVGRRRAGEAVRTAMALDIGPETIRSHLGSSLSRLRRNHVDVLMLHDPCLASLRQDNVLELERLEQRGRIGCWGVSTGDPQVVRRAIELPGIAAIQLPVHPAWLEQSGGVLDRCAEQGIVVIAHGVMRPLAERESGSSSREALARGCLEFALRQRGVSIVLTGTTNARHLAENVELARLVSAETASA